MDAVATKVKRGKVFNLQFSVFSKEMVCDRLNVAAQTGGQRSRASSRQDGGEDSVRSRSVRGTSRGAAPGSDLLFGFG